MRKSDSQAELFSSQEAEGLCLTVVLNLRDTLIHLIWAPKNSAREFACVTISCDWPGCLSWIFSLEKKVQSFSTDLQPESIKAKVDYFQKRFDVALEDIEACTLSPGEEKLGAGTGRVEPLLLDNPGNPWQWIAAEILHFGKTMSDPALILDEVVGSMDPEDRAYFRKQLLRQEKRASEAEERTSRILAGQRRLAEQQQRKAKVRQARMAEQARAKAAAESASPVSPPPSALPSVRWGIELAPLQFQETLLTLPNLKGYLLRERAALWWISNQSDDLLSLPHCRIEHLEYQLRTALRVMGPLRGRALLSDEVGLGKTIEAGLILKEYLTRGMVKRFLILTVPSLVDQWAEELEEKFSLPTVTTNHPAFRGDPAGFWQNSPGVIASLHTFKQTAHCSVAQTVHWDMLVVDEAHYLRKRSSQAWQAVASLPRRFLLLLTATPVQNSLEELYNLITLLQPGQLPSPEEFRDRFVDRERPHQPREPEELRRLIGQVMIRNTRANAGLALPPRQAETILFEAGPDEAAFWQGWERDFRATLPELNPNQASFWGRLLLQAAGSSPLAWRSALESYPATAAARWMGNAPLGGSWRRKCELMIPLTQMEGGVVIFTQFLATQAGLADHLKTAGVLTWVLNGQTPPPERQPLIEEFRRRGGALLLTHSGSEGGNLQFCHGLVNFDLPWNPMEIEQRIGRLHRLGQKHPVRIYNIVQNNTLQAHLLQILQEKLNLFELVIGETGLILGERFSSEEFAEEIFRRWRDAQGSVTEAMAALGDELSAARSEYRKVQNLDATLFAQDYESL